jgi:hypothetical protein
MTEQSSSLRIHVPATAADMLPPRASTLITETANFIRAHWDEVKPYYQCISGESPSMHGAADLDESACVFKVQEIARQNGFAFLGSVSTVKLRRALRFGYKRNTGTPMRLLFKQYRRFQIEQRVSPQQ